MSNKEYAVVLGVGVLGIGGYFLLRKNVNIKTTPLFMHVYVDGKEIGVAQDKGVDVHLSGQHTITFEPYTGWKTPNPQIQNFNLFSTYKLVGTYTQQTGTNLVTNPDFDNGLSGWNILGNAIMNVLDSGTSGGMYADIFATPDGYGMLSQRIPTTGVMNLLLSAYFTGQQVAPKIYATLLNAAGQVIGSEQYASLSTFTTSAFELAQTQFTTTADTASVVISVLVDNTIHNIPAEAGVDGISLISL